jgi:3-(3-hydroxy-phenyl)propionate hydroxylase
VTDRDIIIAGAGPVGLTAALAVRSFGRPVTVIEEGSADRVRPGSRAIFIHRASLNILERIRPGLGRDLEEHGILWRTKRTLYRGREVFRRTYSATPGSELRPATSLPQVTTEKLLLRACLDAGIEFIWSTPVVGVRAGADHVTVETANDSSLTAKYVIGADGARSVVRETAGMQLEGPQTTNAFVIVDTAEDPDNPLPVERVFHYEHPGVDGRNVLYVPFAGHWRIDLQCHPDDDPDSMSGEEGARQWLPKVMPAAYGDRITWVSTYIFRQAVANSFTDEHRRVLLAGEAAHVFAPFGARGLNSGIPDAYLAAKSIDQALKAESPSDATGVIDRFAQARRRAALRNRDASSVALAHLTAPSLSRRIKRRLAAALAPLFPRAGRWLDKAPYGPRLGPADAEGLQY